MFNKQVVRRGIGLVLATFFAVTLASCGDDDKKKKKMEDKKQMAPASTREMPAPTVAAASKAVAPSMDLRILRTALRGVVNSPMANTWVSSDKFVSDFVRLVVNINQNQVKQSLTDFNDFKPRVFKAVTIDNKPYLGSGAYKRFDRLATMVNALDARSLVDLFGRAEQLMQAEYRSYGLPSSRNNFKEQLKRAIDKVAAVNVSQNRIPLMQDSVLYNFESSSLEKAGDLEKLLYRMGPKNSRMIQAKLREIRAQL